MYLENIFYVLVVYDVERFVWFVILFVVIKK